MDACDTRARRCAGDRPFLARAWLSLAWLLCCFAATAGQAAGAAEPLVLTDAVDSVNLARKVEVLVDPDRSLTIDSAREAARAGRFTTPDAAPGDLNFGYAGAAYWLRFELRHDGRPGVVLPSDWLLEIGYPSLDRVELYLGDAREPLAAGDRQPFAERPVPHRNLVFPLALRTGETTAVMLRVESEGSLTVPLTLWRAQALIRHDQAGYTALALYYGALLALLVYNLLLFFAIRDRSYLEYVLFVLGMAIGQLSLNGFGNQFVWPGATLWGHLALPVGFALCGLFAARFTRSFLDTSRTVPRLDLLLRASTWAFGAAIVALLVLPYRHGAILVSVLGPLFSFLAVACGIRCRQLRTPGAGLYLLAWSVMLAGTAVLGARNLGWLPTTAFTTYAMQIGSALEMVLLSFALAERINTMRRERARAQAEALEANQRLLETVQRSEQRLAQQVADRTRELEASNQRLAASEHRLRHMAHHDPLTGLPNRLLLSDRISQALARARRGNCRAAVLLIDLDGFKPINDRLGHAAGDTLLRAVAGRLHATVRAEDTVARLGGDEFVVVLGDVKEPEDVRRVCDAIEQGLRQPFRLGERRAAVGATVGFALYPEDGRDAATLLEQADRAMYRRKDEKYALRPQEALAQAG